MFRILNVIMFGIIVFYVFFIYKYYSSITNINNRIHNRSNINEILKDKITDLPVLTNDTNNIIEFNNSLENESAKDKKRSFWDLIKQK